MFVCLSFSLDFRYVYHIRFVPDGIEFHFYGLIRVIWDEQNLIFQSPSVLVASGDGFHLLPDMRLLRTVKGQYITVCPSDSRIDLQIFFVGFPERVIHFKEALDFFFQQKLFQLIFCRVAYVLTVVNDFRYIFRQCKLFFFCLPLPQSVCGHPLSPPTIKNGDGAWQPAMPFANSKPKL